MSVGIKEFIRIWHESTSLDEVAEKAGIKKGSASKRASRYRAKGVPMKEMPRDENWVQLAKYSESIGGT